MEQQAHVIEKKQRELRRKNQKDQMNEQRQNNNLSGQLLRSSVLGGQNTDNLLKSKTGNGNEFLSDVWVLQLGDTLNWMRVELFGAREPLLR